MTVEALAPFYPWTKSLHLLSVFAWMAGLFYLPRLYVYHTAAAPGSETSETFKAMERRLLRAIMNPAMIATWIFGISLLLTPGIVDWASGWIWTKLAMVGVLTLHHHLLALWFKAFRADVNRHPAGFYRVMNEIPTVALIVIVVMVVVRPF